MGAAHNVAPTEGEVLHTQMERVLHHPRPFSAVAIWVVRPNPSDPSRASGEGQDGSDPPVLPLVRLVEGRGATARATAPSLAKGGSLPSVCIPAGRLTHPPEARAAAPTSGAMIDRLLRMFLVIGVVSCACAVTWPGPFPVDDPLAVLVHYHTPNVSQAAVAWYYIAPGVAVYLAWMLVVSTSRIWFARAGIRFGLRARLPDWPLSPTSAGPAIVIGEVHHPVTLVRVRPELARDPGAGALYRRGNLGAVGPARPPRVCTRSRASC